MASRLAKWVRLRRQLSRTLRTGAAQGRAVRVPAPPVRRTPGQVWRQMIGHRALRPLVRQSTSTISGMISPAFCTSTVSPTRMSFSVMIVLVVQGGIGDGGARQTHRLQHRLGGQHAGAAHLDHDVRHAGRASAPAGT